MMLREYMVEGGTGWEEGVLYYVNNDAPHTSENYLCFKLSTVQQTVRVRQCSSTCILITLI